MKSTVTIEEIKSAYDVPRVWRDLGLEGIRAVVCLPIQGR